MVHTKMAHTNGSTIPHHNHLSLRPIWFTLKWLTPMGLPYLITIISVQDPYGSHRNGSHQWVHHTSSQSSQSKTHMVHTEMAHITVNIIRNMHSVILNLCTIVHTFGQSVYNCVQIRLFCKRKLVILNLCTIVHTFGQSVYNCVQIRLFCKRKLVILNLCTIVHTFGQSV